MLMLYATAGGDYNRSEWSVSRTCVDMYIYIQFNNLQC
jgi:hypothetical protein